jgi:bifunctional non-homologous end joining protein LigD
MAPERDRAAKRVAFSNLDKVMYPGTGFTKGQVIDYYRAVARYLLPHLKDRPITFKRYPDGVHREHFYEKDAPSFTPPWVKTFGIPRTTDQSLIRYVLINGLPTLLWSANLANLELHPFLAKAPHIDRPAMVVFDLDPGAGADIWKSCEVAFLVKDLLDRLRLKSFVKVSGSKGIHLHVPLNTKVTYEATQPFARSVAELLQSEHPSLVVSEMSKAKRRGKVFVDWSQNSEHKSTVAVYSLRAKAERPFVAVPVSWEELEKALAAKDRAALFFEPAAALERLKATGDLFAPVLKLKQQLPQAFLELMAGSREDPAAAAPKLDEYRRKRDFTKTSEPPPSLPRSSRQGSRRLFVVQKHAARRLHYDFRLEMSGTLKSWAVPKGPPYDLHERRLAVATEDHPMEYARFEGVIPRGEYGGGTVMVWDIGTYELIDGNVWQGKLHVFLSGKKLKGEWVLVKGDERNGKDNTWYLIKAGNETTRPTPRQEDSSALTGRSMSRIAEAADAVWHSNRDGAGREPPAKEGYDLRVDELPEGSADFIEPMLARSVATLPSARDRWLYEIKLDGYRCLAGKSARGVKLWSRRGNSLTRDFPSIARACARLPQGTLIDGEIVAMDDQGRPSFNLLQHHRSNASAIRYYPFDLLVYRNRSLAGEELWRRRQLLAEVVAPLDDSVQLSETFDAEPGELVRVARELGLEGIIAKRKDSVYEAGKRSGAWLKHKINRSREFVIGGYTPGNPFDALIVGYYQRNALYFAAKVRNGFVPHSRREVFKNLQPLEQGSCPFINLPEKKRTQWALTAEEMKKCRWVEPALVGQIEFAEWTPDGHLRQASFAGLAAGKEARRITRA